jgi:signal transduction histidine kinase/CRP-like cAMP-binding protein
VLSAEQVKEALASLFGDVAQAHLDELAESTTARFFPAKAMICREGERGSALFVIYSGRVEVLKRLEEEDVLLNTFGPGEFFGEMAFFQEGVRTATIRASDPSILLEIDHESFLQALGRSPSVAMHVLSKMTARLSDTDRWVIVELCRANDTLERTLMQMERVLEVSRELTSTVALEPLLHKIVDLSAELTECDSASILLLDKRTGELRFRAASNDTSGQLSDIPVPVEDSIAGRVFLSGEPAVIADAQQDDQHYGFVGEQLGMEIYSLVAVPLQIKQRTIGVLEVINKRGCEPFSKENVNTLTALAAQAATAIENARLVEELRAAYGRLDALDRLKSDFIAIASHELRTPLSLILGYASVLRDQVGEEASHQLDVVWRAATRLRQIIETMLNLRYLETGEAELSLERFDLREEIVEACEAYRSLAEANGLSLRVQAPPLPLSIHADRTKLRLVLDNLLSNAVKFTQWGGRIRVIAGRRGRQVEIAVVDTGIGIPPQAIDRVFNRFEQVEHHMARRYEGMGLGLAIVKEMVDLHGGQVWAESVPGRGSRFVVSLPIEGPSQAT